MSTMHKQVHLMCLAYMISHSLSPFSVLGCGQQKKHLTNGDTQEEAETGARQTKKVSLRAQMKSQKNWSSA